MSEKFTKEPWEISDMSGVDAMDNYTVCFHIGVSSTGEMIADCQSDNKADYERVRANAHLMKTAPKMYALLNELAGDVVVAMHLACCITDDVCKEILEEDIKRAEKLLAEARGEE